MSAERRYRALLLAYPRAYREARGDEMIDVLLAAEEHGGRWSPVPEAVLLVVHGMAARLRQPLDIRIPAAVGVAGVALTCLLAVVGGAQLVQMSLRALALDGYPAEWQTWRVWVDPRWPVHGAWLATALALLARRPGLAVGLAWTCALLHGWLVLRGVATGWSLPWPGNVGPYWEVLVDGAQLAWFVLTVAALLLIGGPHRAALAVRALPLRRWWTVLAAGLVGAAVAPVAGTVAFALTDPDMRLADHLRGPALPLLLATVVAGVSLLRTPHGRGAVALLAMVGLVPLLARWSDPPAVLLAGGAVFTVGYALGARRRGALLRPLGGAG